MDGALLDLATSAFVTLFVLVDPIGIAPIFVALTAGMTAQRRRRVALSALAIAGGVLALFGLFGERLLAVTGIGLPAFRISGGIMLFIIALEMLFEKRTERRARTAGANEPDEAVSADPARDPTVFPLATPLLAGPGAMAAMILLTARADSAAEHAVIYACLAAVLGLCLVLFFAASLLERGLGPTGILLVTRLFGVLLGALAVQFVLDGLADVGVVASAG